MFRSLLVGLIASLALVPGPAGAQEYPTKPITVIIPYGAGGGILDAAFRKALEEPEIVEKSKALGMQIEYLGPRASRERVDQYYETAGTLLQELGLKK